MEWKENKLVGIIGVLVIVLSLATALYPFVKKQLERQGGTEDKEEQDWRVGEELEAEQKDKVASAQPCQECGPFSRQEKGKDQEIKKFNPFLTYQERKKMQEQEREEAGRYMDFNLSSIIYSPKRSYVVIDGEIRQEGDIIGNYRILQIEPEAVILKDFLEKEYVLKLEKVYESK